MWAAVMGYIFLQNAGISFHDLTSTFFQADWIEPTIITKAATFQYAQLRMNVNITTMQLRPTAGDQDLFYMVIAPNNASPSPSSQFHSRHTG
jgi:hypothetical protein